MDRIDTQRELRRSRTDACLSDFQFDQFFLGLFDGNQRRAVTEHMATCARCRDRRSMLQRANMAVSNGHDVIERAAIAAERLPSAGSTRRQYRWHATVATLAAAAALAVVMWPSNDGIRSKGATRLSVQVKRGASSFIATSGDEFRAGDTIQFVVPTQHNRHVAILNVESGGETTQFFPWLSGRSEPIPAGIEAHTVVLDAAITLDSAPGTELLVGVFCDQPFAVEPVVQQLAAMATLTRVRATDIRLASGCDVTVFELRKEHRP